MTNGNQKKVKSDCLVVIALEEELEIFRKHFDIENEERFTVGEKVLLKFHYRVSQKRFCTGHVLCIGDMGLGAASSLTMLTLEYIEPEKVINIGISGAVSDDIKLGDVVVAHSCRDTDYRGKKVDNQNGDGVTYLPGGETFTATHKFVGWAKSLKINRTVVYSQWQDRSFSFVQEKKNHHSSFDAELENYCTDAPALYVGSVASGNQVTASRRAVDDLKKVDRNILAVDMESAGVARACAKREVALPFMVIRGISDFSDHRKKILDDIEAGSEKGIFRQWAMFSAVQLLRRFLEQWDENSTEDGGMALRLSTTPFHLDVPQYRNKCYEYFCSPGREILQFPIQNFRPFQNLYNKIASTSDVLSEEANDIFERLTSILGKGKISRKVGHVRGPQGNGKSLFFGVLFEYLLNNDTAREFNIYPVLFDLQHIEHRLIRHAVRSEDAARDRITKDIHEVLKLASGDETRLRPIFLIDGIDPQSHFRQAIALSIIENWQETGGGAICIGIEESRSNVTYDSLRPGGLDEADIEILINVESSEEITDESLIKLFIEMVGSESVEQDQTKLRANVQHFNLKSIDLFTLRILWDFRNKSNDGKDRHYSNLLFRYCNDYLAHAFPDRSGFRLAAERAYQNWRGFGNMKVDTIEEGLVWSLINKHDSVYYYLVASHIVNCLSQCSEAGDIDEVLNCFVGDYINRYVKEILRADQNLASNVLEKVAVLYDRVCWDSFIYFTCILGRVGCFMRKEECSKVLVSMAGVCKIDEKRKEQIDSDELRLKNIGLRSSYISLAYLDNRDACSRYIELLFSDRLANALNRGFHLNYYGDLSEAQRYSETRGDDGKPWDKTYFRLMSELKRAINDGRPEKDNSLTQVKIVTLLSFAQSRLEYNNLDKDKAEDIKALVEEVIRMNMFGQKVRTYCSLVLRYLDYGQFNRWAVMSEILWIKRRARRGWLERGIGSNLEEVRNESVAEHSFSAYLMARFLLPDKPTLDGEKYQKKEVLKMILHHDLGEEFTGDYLPSEAGLASLKEQAYYGQMSLMETFSGFYGTRDIWKDFKAFKGNGMSAAIARDFDKLECLYQLYMYREEIEDEVFLNFRNSLKGEISTETVMEIAEDLIHFGEERFSNGQSVRFLLLKGQGE